MLAAINYHYIREDFDAPFPAIFGKTPDQFREQLKLLASYGEFISAGQLKDSIENGSSLPEKSIIITFDDGLKEQYELAYPILQDLGIPAIFFINTKVVREPTVLNVHKIHLVRSQMSSSAILEHFKSTNDFKAMDTAYIKEEFKKGVAHYRYDTPENAELKYLLNFLLPGDMVDSEFTNLMVNVLGMDIAQVHDKLYMNRVMISELSENGFIGSHSHDHLPVGQLNPDMGREQVRLSSEILTEVNGTKPYAFSYPYGSEDAIGDTTEILKENGFLFSFSMYRDINKTVESPFLLNRFDNNDVPGGKSYDPRNFKSFFTV